MPKKSIQNTPAASQQRASKIRLKSFTGDRWHTISVDKKVSDCEQFQIGGRCDHLSAFGIYREKPFAQTIQPTNFHVLIAWVR
jgi:hypothetical protein